MAINLGKPTGPGLRELTLGQEQMLDAWLTSALCTRPNKREPMPVDYTRALAALARRRGIQVVFDGRDGSKPLQVTLDRTIPGCVGGTHRKVAVRKPWK
ncbi:Uncharacterised protein [Mycobacteroides abscessus subsp. abscessus]|uniref:Uncharacterized protein n=1 Tax=Mycobacteroides abscessus subsp. abscessus TaxID=1185650 RepID=A0AB38CVN3_9MYCO|nr:Uncharacterised protein [Mycobacteroides abscessus subsp. abscessus]SIA42099.1 Uncharacterised protein [Mycobacteroides abscessus subsp. abscessus]SIA50328.1 Uncharacterised protein [Mycobacteroides abscessus subsp. abscessus]SIA51073.1 Uncharacterised protein [Mycobacteroides abscessus subsp. abscessus]SKQ80908.1 Uncharacterised protein [Mycobacteroides abscessus subsp. abscessus]